MRGGAGLAVMALALAMAACGSGDGSTLPGDIDDHQAFSEIGEAETVHFTGTEPFWGGEVAGSVLTYSTPESIDGRRLEVERFAGRGGIAFSGTLDGTAFDLLVSKGECSDGMSDRSYPFTATLKLGEEQRLGCAWSDTHPRSGPESP